MSSEADTRHGGTAGWRHDEIQYRLLYATLFIMFFTGIALSRLMPWHWFASRSGDAVRPGIIEQARSTTNKIVPMVFMG